MRLTLRTLLAYLDDTLEPLEIKTIGQKVAESETAQELISRIKQATRRRRITTPPATGPNSFDPNMVADYLDSQLSAEQVAELEKICLESDVHLAEVASCHQILTLVLGEPAHVPPTAKERMYALVRGREAIPFRKAATRNGNASAPTDADADADEMFLLGLPFYRRGSWLRWALPLAAVLLFTVVGVALWQSIHGVDQPATKARAEANNANPEPISEPKQTEVKDAGKEPTKDNDKAPANPSNPPVKPSDANPSKEPKSEGGQAELKTQEPLPPQTKPETKADTQTVQSPVGREEPVKTDHVDAGVYHTEGSASLLVQRSSNKDDWRRVKPGARVSTNDQLMSLPGYASEVWLDNGLHLLLRGHVSEFTPQLLKKDPETGEVKNDAANMDYLQECAVVLHKPNHTDADVTLQRGRLYLSNHSTKASGTIVVRLRFENKVWDVTPQDRSSGNAEPSRRLRVENKVWDITMQPGAEVVLELLKLRGNEEPRTALNLFLLKGNAGLVVEQDNYPNLTVPGMAYFLWDSTYPSRYGRDLINQQQLEYASRNLFAKRPAVDSADARGMERALTTVKKMMSDLKESPLAALRRVLDKPGREMPYEHHLAIYCLGAMDEIQELVWNILNKGDLPNSPDRLFAIVALRRWLDRGPEQSKKLFDPEKGKGLLTDFSFTRGEAERITVLLRDPTFEQMFNSKNYYEEAARDLTSEQVAIAELARWRLAFLVGMFRLKMPKLEKFNAAIPSTDRRPAMQEVLDKVNEGVLPPPEKGKASPGRPSPKAGNGSKPRPKPQR